MPLIDVKGLKVYFHTEDGVVRAVDGVDFTIEAEKTLGVVGESGCGKSVMARATMGLVEVPGRIEAGKTSDVLVSTVDLFTTLLDFAGAGQPSDRDGRSLRPLLLGEGDFHRDRVIGSHTMLRPPSWTAELVRPERAFFLRTARWRYIWYRDHGRYPDRLPEELYRIDRDPRERRNVAGRHPERTREYREAILDWLDRARAVSR